MRTQLHALGRTSSFVERSALGRSAALCNIDTSRRRTQSTVDARPHRSTSRRPPFLGRPFTRASADWSSSAAGGDDGPSSSSGSGNSGNSSGTAFTPYIDIEATVLPPPGGSYQQLVDSLDDTDDMNQLQTALAAAISAEDYSLAGRIRDRLQKVLGSNTLARIDWGALGLPEWLADRAERLSFQFPTEVQRRAAPVLLSGIDAVVQSETGSGKSLAFLVPLLARLRYPPDVFLDDLKGPQALIVVPSMELGVQISMLIFKLFGGNVSQGRPGDVANLFTYMGPRNIKVRGVLNKEEVIMCKAKSSYLAQVHVLVGTPAALAEVAAEPHPQPILDHLLAVVIDEADECFASDPTSMAYIMERATATTTTATLSSSGGRRSASSDVSTSGGAESEEAAAARSASGGAAGASSRGGSTSPSGKRKPQVVMVGATQQRSAVEAAMVAGWMDEPAQVLVGREGSVPSGLSHRYVVCESERRLAVMTRLLRQDLSLAGQDATPARVMVFVAGPDEVAAVAEPLQSVLWSEHRMSVLLPLGAPAVDKIEGAAEEPANDLGLGSTAMLSAGDPLRALRAFRDNKSSLLLCTPQAARGLDLPAVSHVYNLGAPADAAQYLHRAGRAGRIGSTAGGVVTTVLSADELPRLMEMAAKLNITISPEAEPAPPVLKAEDVDADVDVQRKGLEDLFNLL